MPSLDGKVAIVTGAGRGIGREHALALSRAGAKVVVNDLGGSLSGEGTDSTPAQSVVNEIVASGGQAVASYDDVSNFDAAEHMIHRAVERYGRLDILVNNAGILRDRMLVNMEEHEWDAVLEVHLKGHFAPTRHAAAHWRERSKDVTGRVFDVSGMRLSVSEGWHRGPGCEPTDDLAKIGDLVRGLVAEARPNADMQGNDKTE